MTRKFGGIRMRRVVQDDTPRSRYPEWVNAVLPNHEATEERARQEAEAMIAAGEPKVWIMKHGFRSSGVWEYRYYTLTEDIVRLLGGWLPSEVIDCIVPKQENPGVSDQKNQKKSGQRSGKRSGRKSGG